MCKPQQYWRIALAVFEVALMLVFEGTAQIKPATHVVVPAKTGTTTAYRPPDNSLGTGNYVRVNEPQQRFGAEVDITTIEDVSKINRSTQYFDGLGRPLQAVSWKTSPNKMDIVAPVVYDEFGREQYKFLPYEANAGDGTFRTNAFTAQSSFYSTTYLADQPAFESEQYYYSHTQFEASPLNRVLKTFAPGNSWAGSEKTGTDRALSEKAISIQYLVNNSNDQVGIWNIGFDALTDANNVPTLTGKYEPGQLYKTVTLDEHYNAVVEFKDKGGHIVLKKVQIGAIATDYSGYNGFLNTFYVYDDLGQLRSVISPKAVAEMMRADNWTLTATIVKELCFRYEYDERRRIKAKKIPGADWIYLVYDKRDRLCFTQDGNMRKKLPQQWMYTLYDDLNRNVETGIIGYYGTWSDLATAAGKAAEAPATKTTTGTYVPTTSADLAISERDYTVDLYQASNSIVFNEGFTSENGANFIAQISTASPVTFSSPVTVNMVAALPTNTKWYPLTYTYYNSYGFGTSKNYTTTNNSQLDDGGGNTPVETFKEETLPAVASAMTKGMVTGTRVRVIENPDNLAAGGWLETVSFYDDKGRVVQVQADNYKGGRDIVTTRYNFMNKPIATYHVHTNPVANKVGTNQVGIKTSLLYDHAGRLTKTTKSVTYRGTSYSRTIAENVYDALGQLKNKKIGQKSATDVTAMEDDLYTYNIRGWLKGVNYYNGSAHSSQTNASSNKWFGFDLSYDWGMSDVQYNGNIAGMQWKSAGDNKERAYGYGYDQANRLLKADFTQNNTSWGTDAVLNFDVKMGDGLTASTAYDENGNIKQMQHWGLSGTSSDQIDNLIYTYASTGISNKLLQVTDNGTQPATDIGDFKDKNTGSNDYGYDINGNLITDKNKRINGVTDIDQTGAGSIKYNHLNLPYQVTVSKDNGSVKGTITFIYDANGNKVEKRVAEGVKQTQTAYVGGFVYENNKLLFVGHEEGRVRYKQMIDGETGQPVTTFVYDYFLKDHLGNVRMVLTDEVKQDVYPAATLEDAGVGIEKQYYDIKDGNSVYKSSYPAFTNAAGSNYPNNNGNPPYNNNPLLNVHAESQKLCKLNGANDVKFGLGITLKVMAGDNVDIRGKSFYHLNSGQSTSNTYLVSSALLDLLTSFTGGSAVIGKGVTGSTLNSNTPTVTPLTDLLNKTKSPVTSGAPKAGINWILFDEQFKPVSVGFDAVDGAGVVKTHSKNTSIIQNGYLFVYCSNESNIDVLFDNLQLIHNRGPLLEETHYYPFGLTMSGISARAAFGLENKKKYNGIEFENNLDLNTYYANFRELDPQTGRWWQIDPKIENMEAWSPYASNYDNPIRYSDPLGDEPDGPGPKQKSDGLNPFTRAIYNFFVLLNYAGSKINESNGQRTNNLQNNLQAINDKLTENIFAIQAGVEITSLGSSRSSISAKSEESVVASEGRYVFRGDSRPPSEVFKKGFLAKGGNTDLFEHAAINPSNSGFISTSKSPNISRGFTGEEGYVYTISRPVKGVDVNERLGSLSPFPREQEIAVPKSIASPSILGARQVGRNGKFFGPYSKNTYFIKK